MSLEGGRKLEHLEGTHADTGRTCKLHTERTRSELNPGPSCCEATVLTTSGLFWEEGFKVMAPKMACFHLVCTAVL
ncbi:hypothetical protein LDENG_00047840 [Lucifuga dentata]|nr:hypothetical protein LDENG_00047840 [Lucifuga dentata]